MRLMLSLVLLAFVTVPAVAQDCTIAGYADPSGTGSVIHPSDGQPFSAYIVMSVENTVAAAAYSMTVDRLGVEIFLQARFTGPSGSGLSIDEPTGTNSALAECVIGFGDQPVLIDEYVFIALPTLYCAQLALGPNTSQDPTYPQYVTCNDLTQDCSVGPMLFIGCWIATEETSFSTVKSLFRKD